MASTLTAPRTESAAPLRMTWEEFLEFDYEGQAEWVDGEVQFQEVTKSHATVASFLRFFLQTVCSATGLGGAFGATYVMRAVPGKSGRSPDIFVLLNASLPRMGDKFLDGPADLAVEIISDTSIRRDRDDKFREYAEGGVSEYWIIDARPGFERADFFVLAPDPAHPGRNAYRPVPIGDDGVYHSTILAGLWLRVAWLWREDAVPLKCIAEVVGRERLLALLD